MNLLWKWAIVLIAGIVAPILCHVFHIHLAAATLVVWATAVITAMLAVYTEVRNGGKTWWKSKHVITNMLAAIALGLANGFHVPFTPDEQASFLGLYGLILSFWHITWDEATVPISTTAYVVSDKPLPPGTTVVIPTPPGPATTTVDVTPSVEAPITFPAPSNPNDCPTGNPDNPSGS